MRLALADAFDLRRVQGIDLRPALALALLAHRGAASISDRAKTLSSVRRRP